jgi:hypothetical protein
MEIATFAEDSHIFALMALPQDLLDKMRGMQNIHSLRDDCNACLCSETAGKKKQPEMLKMVNEQCCTILLLERMPLVPKKCHSSFFGAEVSKTGAALAFANVHCLHCAPASAVF